MISSAINTMMILVESGQSLSLMFSDILNLKFKILKFAFWNFEYWLLNFHVGQEHALSQEYLDAIDKTEDPKEIETFKQWSKFIQLYAPYILQQPQFCYNMAVNQAPTSAVCIDTLSVFQGTWYWLE